jgi:hypothetical protein
MTAESSDKPPQPPAPAWWTEAAPDTEIAPAKETTRVVHKAQANTTRRSTRTPMGKAKSAKLVVGAAEDFEAKLLRCPACSRANPPDAYYCHFDGKPLFKDLQQMPLQMGSLLFPTPFCFSNGQACTNFNQLALACNNLWDEARILLTEGIWSTFFAAMGRLDLSAAAQQAAKETDADRGLSLLLEKFPADPEFLGPAKLALPCGEVNLAQLTPGTDYTFDLLIQNQGKLLLHGIVLSNFDWLVLGEVKPLPPIAGPLTVHPCDQPPSATASQKMFQTRVGCAIPVLIRGSKLRAGLKPLLGEIIVDTNGGTIAVPVRADIPIRPFPRGVYASDVLAGVRLPRELAVKAKKSPKEAGLLFEQGAVKAWYASNGWTYPIDGADGRGAGAVQQFFEALGLTEPPRLEIDTPLLTFKGQAGDVLSAYLTLRTRDAKPVYAQAWSNCEWAKVGAIQYLGTRVLIPVEVVIPANQGETAQARLTIQGNGKQQFVVPVTVTVKKR